MRDVKTTQYHEMDQTMQVKVRAWRHEWYIALWTAGRMSRAPVPLN